MGLPGPPRTWRADRPENSCTSGEDDAGTLTDATPPDGLAASNARRLPQTFPVLLACPGLPGSVSQVAEDSGGFKSPDAYTRPSKNRTR